MMDQNSELEYLIEHAAFVRAGWLDADHFVSYCQARGIETSTEQLELFEKLGLLYPIARVQYPPIKIKIEYSADRQTYTWLGVLQEGEEWAGDTRDDYADF